MQTPNMREVRIPARPRKPFYTALEKTSKRERVGRLAKPLARNVRRLLGDQQRQLHYALDLEIKFPDELLDQVCYDLQACDAYKEHFVRVTMVQGKTFSRNAFGQCTQQAQPGAIEYFCSCCKFTEPETLLRMLLARYFAAFYARELYAGISIDRLHTVQSLDSLEDASTLQDYRSGRYNWQTIVARHLSRLHWRAVRAEQERMLSEWANFINSANRIAPGKPINNNTVQRQHLLTLLLPEYPPQPRDGQFLIQERYRLLLYGSVQQRVAQFYEYNRTEMNEKPLDSYPLCDVLPNYTLHGFIKPTTPAGEFIGRCILEPENARRNVNALRNFYKDPDKKIVRLEPILERTNLGVETFHLSNTHDVWRPTDAELEVCSDILDGQSMRTFWTRYDGSPNVRLAYQRYFVVPDFECAAEILEYLLFVHIFDEVCVAKLRWIAGDQLQCTNYTDKTFAVAIPCQAKDVGALGVELKKVVREHCVAADVQFKGKLPDGKKYFSQGYAVITTVGADGDAGVLQEF